MSNQSLDDRGYRDREQGSVAPGRTGEWLGATARLFRVGLDRLADDAFDAPAGVPGWSRRHVLGHLHHHALILGRLARSVALGEPETLGDPVDRWQSWRERSERVSARHLRDLARWAEEDLEDAFARLDAAARSSRIAEVPGVRVPAIDLPWLRIRELAIHLVDVDEHVDVGSLPPDLLAALATDLLRRRRHGVGVGGGTAPGISDAATPDVASGLLTCVPVMTPDFRSAQLH